MRRPSFSIFTLGCKVNQYESQQIAKELLKLGFEMLNDDGDIYILNSCAVTHHAERKARKIIYKGKRKGKKIIVTGCISPPMEENLGKDEQILLIPQERKTEIPKILIEIFTPQPSPLKEGVATKRAIGRKRAYVVVQTGCDNFCSYCIVPYLRGKPKSRNLQEVLQEIRQLLLFGYKEIVLCGIRLGKYGRDLEDSTSLSSLLREILNWEGDFRFRLSSIEPMDFDEELLHLVSHPKLCPHFHIPLQSGSDRILKLMGRSYTSSDFLTLVKEIRKRVPLVNITTDVIVGFPSESEEDFSQTLKVCEEVGFGKIHIFPFSPRPGTKAEKWDDVAWGIKKERARVLQALEARLSLLFRMNLIGEKLWILFQGKRGNLWQGISHNYVTCYSDEPPVEESCWCISEEVYENGIKVKLEKGGEENGAMCVLYDSQGRG
ncbi:tRNA (N(6)-L-threonylcarbamoyladenosine(37)-C(2))-methylthiotransferase MtaB [bacterium]|nr:tRNA (N(6)-L-threonylcarbamoyladenosine(37)-C(2))-methylthiotransferase MtaB [bacterium]